jgi:hypothetical protein
MFHGGETFMKTRTLLLFIAGAILLALLVLGVVVVVLTLMGPSINPVGRTCTLMACMDGFTVRFEGEIPAEYSADVTGDDGSHFATTCEITEGSATGDGCLPGGGLEIRNMTPGEVTITVTWDGGSKTETFQQTYEHVEPNGPGCGGDCQRGEELIMTLP